MKPILYSFRRCPYAIRARIALLCAGVDFELREVVLKKKPASMIEYSPKGTVPVLVLHADDDGNCSTDESGVNVNVIAESIDIMKWALARNDPQKWLIMGSCEDTADEASGLRDDSAQNMTDMLIQENDNDFKVHLNKYKYWNHYPEHSQHHYRTLAEKFLEKLEARLGEFSSVSGVPECDMADCTYSSRRRLQSYLITTHPTLADVAVFPLIRQFAHIEPNWFYGEAPYPKLKAWLEEFESSPLFEAVMEKHPRWKDT